MNLFDFIKLGGSNELYLIYLILQKYNCRITEVLNAKVSDFYPDKFLLLKGSKHSHNVIIRDSFILQEISKFVKDRKDKIFFFTNYNRTYRFIKNVLDSQHKILFGNKNRKVTHYFRYENALLINNKDFLSDLLYHKSEKSNQYYLIKNRRS